MEFMQIIQSIWNYKLKSLNEGLRFEMEMQDLNIKSKRSKCIQKTYNSSDLTY